MTSLRWPAPDDSVEHSGVAADEDDEDEAPDDSGVEEINGTEFDEFIDHVVEQLPEVKPEIIPPLSSSGPPLHHPVPADDNERIAALLGVDWYDKVEHGADRVHVLHERALQSLRRFQDSLEDYFRLVRIGAGRKQVAPEQAAGERSVTQTMSEVTARFADLLVALAQQKANLETTMTNAVLNVLSRGTQMAPFFVADPREALHIGFIADNAAIHMGDRAAAPTVEARRSNLFV